MLRKQCLLKTPANWHVNTDIVNQIQDLFTSSQRQKDVGFEKSSLLHFNLQEWIRAREIYHEQTRQCPKTNCCNISQNRCHSFKKGYVYQLINTLWLSLVFNIFYCYCIACFSQIIVATLFDLIFAHTSFRVTT